MKRQLSSFARKSYELFMNGIHEAVDICGRGVDKDEERSLLLKDGSALVVDYFMGLFPFDFNC